MTLIYSRNFGDCVKMLTDRGTWDVDGRIVSLSPKAVKHPVLPIVMATSGSTRCGGDLKDAFLSADADCDVFSIILAIEQSMEAHVQSEFREQAVVAGFSRALGPFHISVSNRPQRTATGTVAACKCRWNAMVLGNGPLASDLGALDIKPGEERKENFEGFAASLGELCRRTPAPFRGKSFIGVAGALDCTTIDAQGVRTEILVSWDEDEVGAPANAGHVALQIGWADIDDAVVDNLIVGTSNLGFKAVTEQVTISGGTGDLTQYGSWQTVDSLDIDHAEGVFINIIASATLPAGESSGSNRIRVRRSDGDITWSGMADTSNRNVSWDVFRIDSNIPSGAYSYELQIYKAVAIQPVSGVANASVRFLYWKR